MYVAPGERKKNERKTSSPSSLKQARQTLEHPAFHSTSQEYGLTFWSPSHDIAPSSLNPSTLAQRSACPVVTHPYRTMLLGNFLKNWGSWFFFFSIAKPDDPEPAAYALQDQHR